MTLRSTATDFYFQGDLEKATSIQIDWVRDHPSDVGSRLFLVELLAFQGEWDRAERQLKALLTNQAQEDAAVNLYIQCIESERKRTAFYSGKNSPKVLGQLTDSMKLRLECFHKSDSEKDQAIQSALVLEAGAVSGYQIRLNGQKYQSGRDGDDLLGTVLEVFANGEYFWVDLSQVQVLIIEKPKYPRDLIWLPARLEMNEEAGNVFLPVLYHGSAKLTDSELRLGRATDWESRFDDRLTVGLGQKEWYFDQGTAVSMVEWRELLLEPNT
jgi:type VI secretion system protein ImpE